MKKMLAVILLSVCSTAFASAPSVTGKWNIHTSIAGNESDQQCSLTVVEKTISGSCVADDKTSPIKGTIDGEKVTFYSESDSNGTVLRLTYKVVASKADQFSGTVDVSPFGVSGEFVATPIK